MHHISNISHDFTCNSSIIVRMYSRRRQLGNIGEDIACQFLVQKGFAIIERNYLKSWGEIDIIAEKKGTVRFIEVKSVTREILPDVTRENSDYRPEEQVHPAKLKKIMRTAEMYMNGKGDSREYQIDVIGVFIDPIRRKARCRLFEQVL
jgi:putative endonuclease